MVKLLTEWGIDILLMICYNGTMTNNNDLYRRDKYVIISPYQDHSILFEAIVKKLPDFDVEIGQREGYKLITILRKEDVIKE